MSFSHVFVLKMTHLPLCSELYCCGCGSKYKQLYEHWEHISVGITLQTGCGGGGGGFSLTDLSLLSHPFFGLSAPEHPVTRWGSARRINSRILARTSTVSYFECIVWGESTVQSVQEMEDEYEVEGGWCYSVLIGAPNLVTLKSLERGRLCGLERVSAPLRCVGITDFKTQWN